MMGNKRIRIVGVILLILIIVLGLCLLFNNAYKGTSDGERIRTEADVKIIVNLPGVNSTPSRAITETYFANEFESFSKAKRNKIRLNTSGSVEGDIPCVFTENREESEIDIVFQDLDYNNISPNIKDIKVYRYYWSNPMEIEARNVDLPYEMDEGKLIFFAQDFAEKKMFNDDTENGIFEIKYEFNNEEYISITAVNVFKDNSNPSE